MGLGRGTHYEESCLVHLILNGVNGPKFFGEIYGTLMGHFFYREIWASSFSFANPIENLNMYKNHIILSRRFLSATA